MADVGIDVASMRQEYSSRPLYEKDLGGDPIVAFEKWLKDAVNAKEPEPNAMTLATVDQDGAPDARMVLLKGVDKDGFRFYSNYDSGKARELAVNPRATLVFWWNTCNRSVRVHGEVSRLSSKESDDYFHSRPLESQLGALASNQSQILESREELHQRMDELKRKYSGGEKVPRPENWGGYLVKPAWIEFWQGQEGRLHDRVRFLREADSHKWHTQRLNP